MLHEEKLEHAWLRHAENHRALKAGLNYLGIKFLVEEEYQLPQLNAVLIPEDIDDKKVRNLLLQRYNIEIGAGLGVFSGKIWRIGQMGYASNAKNILLCVTALESIFAEIRGSGNSGSAAAAVSAMHAKK